MEKPLKRMTRAELIKELRWAQGLYKNEKKKVARLQVQIQDLEAERDELLEDVLELRKIDLSHCHDTINSLVSALKGIRSIYADLPAGKRGAYLVNALTVALRGAIEEDFIKELEQAMEREPAV